MIPIFVTYSREKFRWSFMRTWIPKIKYMRRSDIMPNSEISKTRKEISPMKLSSGILFYESLSVAAVKRREEAPQNIFSDPHHRKQNAKA